MKDYKINRYLLGVLLLLLILPGYVYAQPAPAQKLITVIVSPDHDDWKYKVNEKVTFTVQVLKNENILKDVVVDYELGPESFPVESKTDVRLKNGKTTLVASMKEPGFLRCKVTAKVNGNKYVGMATAAVDQDKILPTTKEPADFDTFWSEALTKARQLPLNPTMTLVPEECTETKNVYQISFQNERKGSRIYGMLSVPKKKGKYPAVLRLPGAGIRSYSAMDFGEEVISLAIGIHGIPVRLPQEVYANLYSGAMTTYYLMNRDNRDSYYFKRVYIGCVRAVDFIYSLPEFDGSTIGVTGGSQGGALSIVTTALDARVKFLAVYYPTLCDYAGYLHGRAGGWPHFFKKVKPTKEESETLAYFDVVNFARRIKVPGWYSWGYNDETCPPTSMFSAYNVIPGKKELHLYQETAHWTYPEQQTESKAWLQKQCGK